MRKLCLMVCLVTLGCGGSVTGPGSTKTGETAGLVTFTIDDGWRSTYNNAIPILDAHNLKSTDYIITGRFNNNDYINQSEVLSLYSRGHEIGAHTRSHTDMTQLHGSQLQDEILGSKNDLISIGIRSVPSFSYPFGLYNSEVVDTVKKAGFSSARAIIDGYNTSGEDVYLLKRKNLGGTVTAKDAENWIDTAVSNRSWLIFLVHHVDSTISEFSVTPQLFQEVVNYLVDKKVRVVTVTQGIQLTQ